MLVRDRQTEFCGGPGARVGALLAGWLGFAPVGLLPDACCTSHPMLCCALQTHAAGSGCHAPARQARSACAESTPAVPALSRAPTTTTTTNTHTHTHTSPPPPSPPIYTPYTRAHTHTTPLPCSRHLGAGLHPARAVHPAANISLRGGSHRGGHSAPGERSHGLSPAPAGGLGSGKGGRTSARWPIIQPHEPASSCRTLMVHMGSGLRGTAHAAAVCALTSQPCRSCLVRRCWRGCMPPSPPATRWNSPGLWA